MCVAAVPQHFAAQRGHEAVVRQLLLLQSRLVIDRTNCDGGTALYFAAQEAHVPVVRALIEVRACMVRARRCIGPGGAYLWRSFWLVSAR